MYNNGFSLYLIFSEESLMSMRHVKTEYTLIRRVVFPYRLTVSLRVIIASPSGPRL